MNAGLNELSADEFDIYNEILTEIFSYTKPLKEQMINQYLKISSWTKVESYCHAIHRLLGIGSYIRIARQLRLYLMIIK